MNADKFYEQKDLANSISDKQINVNAAVTLEEGAEMMAKGAEVLGNTETDVCEQKGRSGQK